MFNPQKRTRRHNTSGFTGVVRSRDDKKWVAQINQAGERVSLGTYDTPEQASQAYQNQLRLYKNSADKAAEMVRYA